MKEICLICTVHEECGQASVSALQAILECLRPEVVFFEAPPEAFDDFIATGFLSNLESTAVRRYCEHKNVEVVLVDLPTPKASFFVKLKEFNQRIENKSSDFRRLMLWNKNYIRDYGFPYLNCEHSSKMWSEIYSDIRTSVKIVNDQEITDFFALWESTNDRRENEMLRNISKYCSAHSFERAVFLVGAAHRSTIMEKSQNTLFFPEAGIQWDFAYYERQALNGS